ncbi:MAG: hypothetical protein ABW088_12520 [Sedimenticola sp.]
MSILFKQNPKKTRRLDLARAMLASGMNASPVQHPMQAVARVTQSWAGNKIMKEAEEAEEAKRKRTREALSSILSGRTPPFNPDSVPNPVEGTGGIVPANPVKNAIIREERQANSNGPTYFNDGQEIGVGGNNVSPSPKHITGKDTEPVLRPQQTIDRRMALANALMGNPDTADYGIEMAFNLAMEKPEVRKIITDARGRKRYQDTGDFLFEDMSGYDKDILSPEALAQKRQVAEAGRSSVTVSPGMQESERQKAYGKSVGGFYGNQFSQLQEGAQSAMQNNARLDRLDQLLDQVNTGATAGITQPLKRYAQDFGIDLEAMGITNDTGPAEAAQALSNQMALELRNPAGGAGMPGALSDRDREFLTSMVPQMTTTPEGRKMLIETKRRQNKRAIEVARLARDYQQRNGMLDAGFYQELQNFSDANPLFADMGEPPQQSQSIRGGAAEAVKELNGKRYIKINGRWYQQ